MNWTKIQAYVMIIALIGGALGFLIDITNELAVHTTQFDNIKSEVQRLDKSVTALNQTINDFMFRSKQATHQPSYENLTNR
jgi:uncharacterized membrane protein (DUF106 family)